MSGNSRPLHAYAIDPEIVGHAAVSERNVEIRANENPTAINLSATDINENNAAGAVVATLTATDPDGLYDTAHQTVTVADTTPPQITVPNPITIPASDPAGATVTYVATASDIVDPIPGLSCEPVSGSQFPGGETTVTCDASMGVA